MPASAVTAQSFSTRLPEFFAFVKSLGINPAPATYLAVHDLVFTFIQQQKWPSNPKAVAAILAPILVKNPEQQQLFYQRFYDWYLHRLPAPEAVVDSIPSAPPVAKSKPENSILRYIWLLLIVFALLTVLCFNSNTNLCCVKQEPQPTPQPTPVLLPTSTPQTTLEPSSNSVEIIPVPPLKSVDPIDIITPRVWPEGDWVLPLLPLLLLLGVWWFLHRKRQLILDEYQSVDDDPFQQLALKVSNTQLPFAGLDSQGMRRSERTLSRRLNVRATVDNSLRRGGLFSPQYRYQYRAPEYLVFIDRQHLSDHVSALADSFMQQLKSIGLLAQSYYYQQNLRVCFAAKTGEKRTLTQLLNQYAQARVFMVGDASGLFNSYTGQLQPWVKSLKAWREKTWLSTEAQPWGYREYSLMTQGFLVAPFSLEGVEVVSRTLQQGIGWVPGWYLGEHNDNYPKLLYGEAQQWLRETPPSNTSVTELIELLKRYMGAVDFKLLQALAAYPMPTGTLTMALDQKLFPLSSGLFNSNPHVRANRLLKLSRLPWCRYGRMPRYLRRALVDDADPDTEESIAEAYFGLFEEAKPAETQDLLKIPFVSPEKRQALLTLLTQLWGRHRSLGDRLFIRTLLGRRRPWYLHISDHLARAFKLNIYQGRLMLGLACLGAITSAGMYLLWHFEFSRSLFPFTAEHAVEIQIPESNQELAQRLATQLRNQGYPVSFIENSQTASSWQPTLIRYPFGEKEQAIRIQNLLRLIQQGPGLIELKESAIQVLQLTLGSPAVFYEQWQSARVFQDSLKAGGLGPKMVVLPAGQFEMGSPESEVDRSDREGPQHTVILPSFALMQTEVTFNDWEQCVAAGACNNLGIEKAGGDEDWGGGRRPIINVNWQDTQEYALWLSQQTGYHYRLPSEAEWEYAARAGTSSPFSTGNCISSEQANYHDEYSYSNCEKNDVYLKRTAPVASYPANAFGLYDMHGNVWEWVEDCWHQNYSGAPPDGAAWLEANGGDCDRRVVRGGSWDIRPQVLRSAGRSWYLTDERFNNLGFRLARTLEKNAAIDATTNNDK